MGRRHLHHIDLRDVRCPLLVVQAHRLALTPNNTARVPVRLTGQDTQRRTAPWLRSMRGERPELAHQQGLTGFEKGLAAAVVLGVVAFEGWFFFFAGSSIG